MGNPHFEMAGGFPVSTHDLGSFGFEIQKGAVSRNDTLSRADRKSDTHPLLDARRAAHIWMRSRAPNGGWIRSEPADQLLGFPQTEGSPHHWCRTGRTNRSPPAGEYLPYRNGRPGAKSFATEMCSNLSASQMTMALNDQEFYSSPSSESSSTRIWLVTMI